MQQDSAPSIRRKLRLLSHCRRAAVLGVVSIIWGVSITAVVTAVTETPQIIKDRDR
jgi:hypothetical protein